MVILAAIMTSIIWSYVSSSLSHLSKVYNVFEVILLRVLFGSFIFGFLALFETLNGSGFSTVSKKDLIWIILTLIGSFGIGDILFLKASKMIGISMTLVISSFYPVWLIFLNQTLNIMHYLGIFFIILSLIISLSKEIKKELKQNKVILGYIFAILVSLTWSFTVYSINQISKETSLFALNFVRMLLASFVFSFIVFKVYKVKIKKFSFSKSLFLLLLLDSIGSLFGYYAFNHGNVVVSSALTSLAPLCTLISAVFLKSEHISFNKGIAILIGMLGIIIVLVN